MSELTQKNNTVVILLVVVAVLLAAVVGVIIYQQSTAVPSVSESPTGSVATGAAPTDAAANPSATDPGASTTPAEVDTKSATTVKGDDLKGYVEGYYKSCDAGDWEAAFNALPADKKEGNSPDALKEQVSGYGVESFTVADAEIQGDTATVKADQVTASYGTFENTWTFTKKGDTWYVTSKAVTGMK